MARGKPAWRPFKSFLYGFLVLILVALGSAAALVYREFNTSLPPVDRLADYRPSVASRVFADDGTLIGEFFVEKRYLAPIYKIPKVVQLAFVAAEDASFFEHTGFDPMGIVRAALHNYNAGSTKQGGSTITQQVVKSLLLSPERSYERKLKEIVLAVRLERQRTKEEILYLYLNQIFLGNGAYGVQAAALEYFGKDVSQLSLAEAALLAGLPQAPSRYSPVKHFRRAKARQRYVLQRMAEERFVSREEAERAAEERIVLARHRPAIVGPAPYFVQHVRQLLERRYGSRGPSELGLDVYTTLDLRLQRVAEERLRAGVAAVDRRQGFRGPIRSLTSKAQRALLRDNGALPGATDTPLPDPGFLLEVVITPAPDGAVRRRDGGVNVRWAGGPAIVSHADLLHATDATYEPRVGDVLEARVVVGPDGRSLLALTGGNGTQGALVAMAPATGDVKALVGGLDFDQSQFNRVTQALRQPGSAFKPLVYAAAMDHGYTPASIINDSPVSYRVGGEFWRPQNFDKRFHGATTLRDGLTFSRNVVSVKLVQAMGVDYLLGYLPRFGFERRFPRNLSVALGSSEVTLLELARAYGVFPNLGVRVEPRFIKRITNSRGDVVENFPVRSERVMPQETAFMLVSMMQSVIERGTGRHAADLARPVAGKTGTTNDLRDAWFMGFAPDLLAGVWVGYDHDKTLGEKETGGQAAAPIWRDFMAAALENAPVVDFPVPQDIVLVNIDRRSGLRAGEGTERPVLEAFRRGSEPTVAVAAARPKAPSEDPDAATLRRIRGAPPDAGARTTSPDEPSPGF